MLFEKNLKKLKKFSKSGERGDLIFTISVVLYWHNTKQRSNHMTDWKAIKAEYIRGGTSYRKLCAKYGVSFSNLTRRAGKEKWTDLRQQSEDKSTTKLIEKVSDESLDKGTKIIDVANKLLDRLSQAIDTMDVIDTQSLKQITSALKDLKDIKGYKSAMDLKEQEARIAKLEKEAQNERQDNEIKVTIECDLDEYSK